MAPVIEARELVKRYGEFTAVKRISFSVELQECFGLLGPNGAGKTSTIRMISCVSPLSSGTLLVGGKDVRRQAREIKARLGVVPQENNPDPDLSVLDNLLVYARYFDISSHEARRRAMEALELFQLTDRQNSRVDTLSGGMKRRLILARALINNPEILILDEPTTGLDPQAKHLIWQKVRQLKAQGATILLSTHNMEEAARLCDRLVIMHQGEILAEGSPEELVARYAGDYVLEISLNGQSKGDILSQMDGLELQVQDMEDTLYIFGPDSDAMRRQLRLSGGRLMERAATLEDVFLRLTGRALAE